MDDQQAALNEQIRAKLTTLDLGSESIQVFGRLRLNVHVICVSIETARKWAAVLSKMTGARASLVAHSWNAEANRGTSMLPTKRHGYLIAVAA